MINMISINESLKQKRRLEFGCDVEVVDDHRMKIIKGAYKDWYFPYQLARWNIKNARYAVLIEPIVVRELRPSPWPFSPVEIYKEDQEAMRRELRHKVMQTIK